MKKALTILGALALTFGATQVHANNGHGKHRHGNHGHNNGYTYTDYARVTYVEPLYKYVTVRKPQRHCTYVKPNRYNHQQRTHGIRYQNRHRSQNNSSAVFVGGVIGGVIGNEVSRSTNSNRVTGTVVGAAIGSVLANNAAGHQQRPQRYLSNQRLQGHGKKRKHCVTTHVSTQERHPDGYNVTYVYNGRTFKIHTYNHPGDRIQITVQARG